MLAGVEVNYPLIDVNGLAYFPGRTDSGDFHLWRSDGTLAGTRMVSSARMYVQNSEPHFLTEINGTLFFSANDESQLPRLWKSDGTEAGTKQVTLPGHPARYISHLTAVGDTLFFDAFDGSHRALWKSDGTDAGTVLVKDIYVGGSDPYMTNVNGTLFFMGNDENGGDELWKSDGTEAGTVRVKDIVPGPTGSGVSQLTNVNGQLFFTSRVGISGKQLWVTDGTEAGTVPLKYFPGGIGSNAVSWLAAIGNKLYFQAHDGSHGDEPWVSDGTPAGTQLLKDIAPGSSGSAAEDFVNQNGTAFFYANSTGGMGELWKSDGTTAGTELVAAPFDVDAFGNGPFALTAGNGVTFFATQGNLSQDRLWKTDGTASGTIPVRSFAATFAFPFPEQFVHVGNRLFFTRKDDTSRPVLWVSDGTPSGTVLLDLSVNPGNHAPEGINDQIYIVEDQQLIADPPGVLINDVDVDRDPLTAALSQPTSHGTISLDLAGNFTYRPSANFSGIDQFVYRASDGTASSGQTTVTIHIAPVNDRPSFTAGANQTVTDDAGEQVILNWTQDASAGPANESIQQLAYDVLADQPSLFLGTPQITSGGHLIFTPAPNAQGDVTLTVTLQDNGGTANGGQDTSPPQTFTISIYKLHPWRNTLDPLDVNGDTVVAADDALAIINFLNAVGSGKLPEDADTFNRYYDTDGDGECTANDVLTVINSINARPTDSEAPTAQPSNSALVSGTDSDLLSLLAADIAAAQPKRRR